MARPINLPQAKKNTLVLKKLEAPESPRCVAGVIILTLQPRNVATLAIFSSRVATLRGWSFKIITPATQRGLAGTFVKFCSLPCFRGTTVIFFLDRWWRLLF